MGPKKDWEGLMSLDVGDNIYEYAHKRIFGLAWKYRDLCYNGRHKFPEQLQPPVPLETKEQTVISWQGCRRIAAEHGT